MDLVEWKMEIDVFVVSPMRIYREGLSHVLAEESAIRVVGTASSVEDAVPLLAGTFVDVILFDVSVDSGLAGVRRLSHHEGQRVVVLGVVEDEKQIVSCAEAGIAGYVTRNDSVAELVQTIYDAARGEFTCPPRIAGGLVRRLATVGGQRTPISQRRLTVREQEIVRLIELGLSNKEIAKRLSIQVATVKNHVHNILEKLGVSRRADAAAALRT